MLYQVFSYSLLHYKYVSQQAEQEMIAVLSRIELSALQPVDCIMSNPVLDA